MGDPSSDASEFTRYYEEHKRSIFNYILYRVSFNHDTAEDLTSEIFLKVWKHFDTFDRTRSFKTWVFAIAHNHLVNYYAGRKEVLPLDEAVETVKVAPASDEVERSMTIEKILEIVKRLPEAQQELIIMRYVNDLSHTEIANILGKEEGAIRTALSRAIATIRQYYSVQFSDQPL